jgi:wyosine [tRNA(Phe)-imidazoG37] synthetase (radical SAM superfamily)
MRLDRQAFYKQEKVIQSVYDKVAKARAIGETINYLTFVPDGEPTLDLKLAAEISALRELDIPIAVISNASLIWREDVRDDLMGADWVSLKVDAVSVSSWHRINRPHGSLDLHKTLDGMRIFAGVFEGELATETMLVEGVNDDEDSLGEIAHFLGEIQPAVAYVAIPTRPPAEEWVHPPQENRINRAYQLFREQVDRVELLLGYEGNAFASTGDAEEDLLSITAVHPMRKDAVDQLLQKAGSNWSLVENLIRQDKLVEIQYDGRHFYLRRFAMPKGQMD